MELQRFSVLKFETHGCDLLKITTLNADIVNHNTANVTCNLCCLESVTVCTPKPIIAVDFTSNNKFIMGSIVGSIKKIDHFLYLFLYFLYIVYHIFLYLSIVFLPILKIFIGYTLLR